MWRWEQLARWLVTPRRGVELGVYAGRTTQYLLQQFRELHMTAVDMWSTQPLTGEAGDFCYDGVDFAAARAEFDLRTAPFADRLTVLQMDTVAAAGMVADGSLDFVFIDSHHTYSRVKAEILAWKPKLRPGGLLTGHDYSKRFPGVIQAVDETGRAVRGAQDTWMIPPGAVP